MLKMELHLNISRDTKKRWKISKIQPDNIILKAGKNRKIIREKQLWKRQKYFPFRHNVSLILQLYSIRAGKIDHHFNISHDTHKKSHLFDFLSRRVPFISQKKIAEKASPV